LQLAAQGQLDQAFSDLVAALSIAEASGDRAWISLFARNIGMMAEQLGRWSDAARYYQLACDVDPADPHVKAALGGALTEIGNIDHARRELHAALEIARARDDLELAERVHTLLARTTSPPRI